MKIEDLAFPVTFEAFVAFQEAGMGRKLEDMELDALKAWVKLFNLAYLDGVQGNNAALAKCLSNVDKLIDEHGDDTNLAQILKSCRWWIEYAWKLGFKEAGKVAAV